MNDSPEFSLVVPRYDEEDARPHFFAIPALETMTGGRWRTVCGDDGSRDRTFEWIVQKHLLDPRVTGVRLSRNFGRQPALAASLAYGFMSSYPGPGLGGQCIPIDPFYLSSSTIIHLLGRRGALVGYSDPFMPQIHAEGIEMQAVDAEVAIREADCVVILTDHKKVDYPELVKNARLIVDTRNALKGIQSERIVRL